MSAKASVWIRPPSCTRAEAPEIKDRLRLNTEEVIARGGFGSPDHVRQWQTTCISAMTGCRWSKPLCRENLDHKSVARRVLSLEPLRGITS